MINIKHSMSLIIISITLIFACNSTEQNSNNGEELNVETVGIKDSLIGTWESFSYDYGNNSEYELSLNKDKGVYIIEFKKVHSHGYIDSGKVNFPIIKWEVKNENLVLIEYGKVTSELSTINSSLCRSYKELELQYSYKTVEKNVVIENNNALLLDNKRFLRK